MSVKAAPVHRHFPSKTGNGDFATNRNNNVDKVTDEDDDDECCEREEDVDDTEKMRYERGFVCTFKTRRVKGFR